MAVVRPAPRFRAARIRGGAAVILATIVMVGASASAAVASSQAAPAARPRGELRETVVLRLPVGPHPSEISDRECTGREPLCAAGLAFVSPADSLYFYDIGNDNLKVIALKPAGRLARVVPGLGSRLEASHVPIAGAAGTDGALELWVGAPGSAAPPALWTLESGSSEWRRASAAPSRGASAKPDAKASTAARGLPAGSLLLGRDRAGRSFAQITTSLNTQVLAAYAPDGRVISVTSLPERPIWKMLLGGTDMWVTGRGEVVEVYVSSRWLVVSMWSERS